MLPAAEVQRMIIVDSLSEVPAFISIQNVLFYNKQNQVVKCPFLLTHYLLLCVHH